MGPSDAAFRLLVDNVRDQAIVFVDAQGAVRSWNAGATQLTGYERDDVLGKSLAIFFTDDEAAAGLPQRSLAEALRTGSFEDIGWRRRKDGSRFWAQATTTAIRDESGAHIGFAKVIRDLRDSAYRAFVEASNAIVWSADVNGRANADSPSWRAFTGQSEAEWRAESGAFAPVHPDDLENLAVAWTTAREQGASFECEFRLRRRDGVYVWMAVRALPLRNPDGRVREWFGVTFDIAARKKAESELETSLGWWTTTLTSIGDAVIATDQAGAVRFMNPVAERLTGYSLQQAQGRPLVDVFHIVNEATRAPVDNPVAKVLAQGAVVGLANHTILVRPDHSEIP
ncbi:MAG TPA: PAS domain S-box protein, partial [Myxococcota bacterium]